MSNKHFIKGLKRRARRAGLGRHGSSQVILRDLMLAKKAQTRIHQADQRTARKAADPAVDLLHRMEEEDRQRSIRVRGGGK